MELRANRMVKTYDVSSRSTVEHHTSGATQMRTTFFAALFIAAIACGGSETERVLVESKSVPAPAIDDTAHYQVLDQILLRTIGEDYRKTDGEILQRMEATRLFLDPRVSMHQPTTRPRSATNV